MRMPHMAERGPELPMQRDLIDRSNASLKARLALDLESLRGSLQRSGTLLALDTTLEEIMDRVAGFEVVLPSWGLGTGGTRFGRFPGPGEPTSVFEKLEDAALVQQLTRGAGAVSLHVPWDSGASRALSECAQGLGLRFDAMNSNTFQDQPGQRLSYKFGSLSHPESAVRRQAIDHNLEVIAIGEAIGSKALSVWIGDGSDTPGQSNFRRSLERVADSLAEIYKSLPGDWKLFVEYKPYEPAFYSTVIQDWGTALHLCQGLGDRAHVLVDLGHHLPGTNIEQIVSRLIQVGRLGGVHLNDSKYGDDDLTAGSIRPFQLFLIFCELVAAEREARKSRQMSAPTYLIDQSHNTRDPIEALIVTVEEARRAYAKALFVDFERLAELQDASDPVLAELVLKNAFETDVRPVLAAVRLRDGGAIDPIGIFRESGYRLAKARERKPDWKTAGGMV